MKAAALVVIWTLASELSSPATNAMTGAASEALGADTELRVEVAPDPEGIRLSDVGSANVVIRLTWDEAEHRRARITCFSRRGQRWIDREVVFEASDPERERGRTLGFLLASMVLHAANDEVAPRTLEATDTEAARSPAEIPPSDFPPPRSEDEATASSLAATAELASAGAVSGYGFWFGVERAVADRELWIGGGAHARFGSIVEAQASSRLLGLGVHMTWLPLHSGALVLGTRLGGSLSQLSAKRWAGSGSGEESQDRVLPSAEVLGLLGFRLAPRSVFSAQLGGEFLSGVTAISVRGQERATWPWAALLTRVGVETAF